MSKNIAIFLDGTWNQVDDYTNVYSLYQYCLGTEMGVNGDNIDWGHKQKLSEPDQVRYYDPGVGTSPIASPVLIGGAIGYGLSTNVAQAYLSLCREYQPGDRIFIFGFSRGAYTARSLGGLLNRFGVLLPKWIEPATHTKIPPKKWLAHRRALKIPKLAVRTDRQASQQRRQFKRDQIIQKFKGKYCRPDEVRIKFMGVFDTVGAMGIPSLLDPLGNRRGLTGKVSEHFFARNLMPDTDFPGNVDFACHALAIDEYRPHFKPTLWTKTNECVEQRWFIGAHSNVGGGYPNSLLNNKPMYWIYQHARSHGLRMGNFLVPHDNVHLDEPIDDSFASFRLPYQLSNHSEYYRSLDLAEARSPEKIDDSQSLDDSVLKRIAADPVYRPPNVMRLENKRLDEIANRAAESDQKLKEQLKPPATDEQDES